MPITPLNVDDRSFEDLVLEAKRRIVAYTPEWTDFNESDPGITLVQLFAWLTQTMLYRLNRVPDDRMFVSFMNLIGYGPSPAVPATAIIEVKMAPGSGTTVVQSFELALSAPGKDDDIPFEADAPVPLVGASLAAVLVDDGISLARIDESASNAAGTAYEPFGPTKIPNRALYLGLDATRAAGPPLLVEDGQTATLQLFVRVADSALPLTPASTSTGVVMSALDGDLIWEGKLADGSWQAIDLVADDTRALRQSGFLRLRLPSVLAASVEPGDSQSRKLFWIRARVPVDSVETRKIVYVIPNAARVRQWRTYARELLPLGSDGTPNQTRPVRHPPILLDDAEPPILEVNQPDVGGALVWTAWTFVRDLGTRFVNGVVQAGDMPLSVFTTTDDQTAAAFGDGLRGLIPLRGPNNVRVTYRSSTGGSAGNVSAGKLSLDASLPNVDGIEQREAASGGVDEETADSAKGRAPDRIRALERAVTALDFETLAEEKAGVARATAVNRRHPMVPNAPVTGAVTLVVVPPRAGDDPAPLPSQLYLDEVARTLEPFRVLTTELFVVPPRYRALSVEVEVDVSSLAAAAAVRAEVSSALSAYFDPITGGNDGTGWPLGGTIPYGEVLSTVLKLKDVAGVRTLTLNLDGSAQPACSDVTLGDLDLLAAGGHKVRVNAPEVKR